jgi:hypothetical protein
MLNNTSVELEQEPLRDNENGTLGIVDEGGDEEELEETKEGVFEGAVQKDGKLFRDRR